MAGGLALGGLATGGLSGKRSIVAMGHSFGCDLRCVCGASWEAHNRSPAPCEEPGAAERLRRQEHIAATRSRVRVR